jgi:hypothetical protein
MILKLFIFAKFLNFVLHFDFVIIIIMVITTAIIMVIDAAMRFEIP